MVAVQSRSGRPLMSTASDPHMPCPQEYRKFSVGSTSRLICSRASRTVRCGAMRIVYSCVQRRPRARRLPAVAKGLLLANGLVRAGRSDWGRGVNRAIRKVTGRGSRSGAGALDPSEPVDCDVTVAPVLARDMARCPLICADSILIPD